MTLANKNFVAACLFSVSLYLDSSRPFDQVFFFGDRQSMAGRLDVRNVTVASGKHEEEQRHRNHGRTPRDDSISALESQRESCQGSE